MQNVIDILRAADTAARWHAAQRRKGEAKEPYVNHLLEVALLVAEATNGRDAGLVTAALLHDAVEDAGATAELIADAFGDDVASLVMEVTDDKELPVPERKRRQIEHAPHLTTRGGILKLADKTSNLRAIAGSPPADWPVRRKLEYVRWAREVVLGLREPNPWLLTRFTEAADAADRAIGPAH